VAARGAGHAAKRSRASRAATGTPRTGQVIELDVQSMSLEGEGVARSGQYVLFVPGVIPGERVEIEVVSVGRRYGRGQLRRVVHASPFRVRPRCRHFGPCGGCAWQHIDYAEQLRTKERLLRQTIEHQLPGVHLPIRPVRGAADPWGTRTKVHFVLHSAGGKLALGHYRLHAREPLAVEECPVHAELGNQVARQMLTVLQDRDVSAYHEAAGRGVARHVVLRIAESPAGAAAAAARPSDTDPTRTPEIDEPTAAEATPARGRHPACQATLVAARAKFPALRELGPALLAAAPAVSGVHLNVQSRPGPIIFGPETRTLAGRDHLVEQIAGVRFYLSPTSFFQTSAQGAAQVVETVLRQVRAGPATVLDLYAGVGLFAAPLAQRGHRVLAVEENPTAVADGILTLQRNRIAGCRFIRSPVETALKRLASRESIDVVVLDPPREGCPDWVLRLIARTIAPERIIDVSCSPAALARDLAILTRAGYRVAEIQPIDLFPHTAHIESVTLLVRG
jgi:23S rRNA (uracil1939-C5)-methyltransferase